MKKLLASIVITAASSQAMAVAPGGPNCGWGNMLFEGQSGLLYHALASYTNASTYNGTLGMTSGTNGCSTSGTLTYGGDKMVDISSLLDEFSEDVARGDGEVLTAFVVSIGVDAADREAFKQELHNNFDQIFTSANVTAEEVVNNIASVISADESLAKYVS
ncbi:MAG: DUF3015 domain-containing protein [Pseudomonadales bacterium]|nr:DUF3015 domain-containing protein [Pseudomonadales bacterium]